MSTSDSERNIFLRSGGNQRTAVQTSKQSVSSTFNAQSVTVVTICQLHLHIHHPRHVPCFYEARLPLHLGKTSRIKKLTAEGSGSRLHNNRLSAPSLETRWLLVDCGTSVSVLIPQTVYHKAIESQCPGDEGFCHGWSYLMVDLISWKKLVR